MIIIDVGLYVVLIHAAYIHLRSLESLHSLFLAFRISYTRQLAIVIVCILNQETVVKLQGLRYNGLATLKEGSFGRLVIFLVLIALLQFLGIEMVTGLCIIFKLKVSANDC